MRAVFLSLLLPLGASAAGPATVALDLRGLDESTFAAIDGVALEKSATVRLVQEGFAVVAASASPEVLVSLTLQAVPRALVLRATGPGGTALREVPWGTERLGELHLELVQKLVELTREVDRAPEATLAAPPAPPGQAARWALTAAGGVLVRGGGVDPAGVVGARWGTWLQLAVEVGLCGSRGVSLDVLEGTAAAGPALALPLGERFRFELAALVGGLLHSYRLEGATAEAGARFNVFVTFPIGASFQLAGPVRLALRLAPGWGLARAHLASDQVLWSRDALRLEAGLGVFVAL